MVKRRKLKKKSRPPRLYTDEKGRYIKVKGQKTYIHSPLTSKQLVRVIINNFEKRAKKRKKRKGKLSKGQKYRDHLAELIQLMSRLRTPANDIRSVIGMIPAAAAAAAPAPPADDDAPAPPPPPPGAGVIIPPPPPAGAIIPAPPPPAAGAPAAKKRGRRPRNLPEDDYDRLAKQIPRKTINDLYISVFAKPADGTKAQHLRELEAANTHSLKFFDINIAKNESAKHVQQYLENLTLALSSTEAAKKLDSMGIRGRTSAVVSNAAVPSMYGPPRRGAYRIQEFHPRAMEWEQFFDKLKKDPRGAKIPGRAPTPVPFPVHKFVPKGSKDEDSDSEEPKSPKRPMINLIPGKPYRPPARPAPSSASALSAPSGIDWSGAPVVGVLSSTAPAASSASAPAAASSADDDYYDSNDDDYYDAADDDDTVTPRQLISSMTVAQPRLNQDDEVQKMLDEMDQILTPAKGSGSGKDGLYDDEIQKLLSNYVPRGFKGVYSIDEIDQIPVSNKMAFILNLDPSYKSGSHWVAVFIDTKDAKAIEYYDSYGDDPPKRFYKDIKKLIDKLDPSIYLKFKVNKIKYQRENSSNCGWFAIKFIMDRFNGIPFKDCTGFSKVLQSERRIRNFKSKFSYI